MRRRSTATAATAAAVATFFALSSVVADRAEAQSSATVSGTGFQPRAIWVNWCTAEVERTIRAEHPHTSQIDSTRGPVSEWAWSRTESAVAGSGRMLRGKVWDEFDYICVIDERAGRVSQLEWRLRSITLDEAPARACIEAVVASIRADHPATANHRIEASSLRQWRRSDFDTGVRGEGVFAGRRGKPHEFEFGCVWNRRGAVSEVFYNLM